MGTKRMLINVYEDETRIALTDESELLDLHVEQSTRGRTAGNIYRGTVEKVNPSFQAAFIDYGEKKNGFLSLSDLNPTFAQGHKDTSQGRPRIQSLLKHGQSVMVQVLKEGMGAKGAALSTNIAIPGRYMVLNPYSDRTGVSRKIDESKDRARFKEFLTGLSASGMGVIIRTAGLDRSLTDLKRDFTDLRREWKTIHDRYERAGGPALVYREPDSVVRVLRDYFSEQVKEVWVDSAEVYQTALEYFKRAMPKFQKRLKLYVGERSLFSLYEVEERIEALDSSKVSLKSGGSIVIESTEALVSIDVNSGRSNQESDIEETALRTNLEAADEIARQLRLRNLGGLIVIDFIDMVKKPNQRKVVQAVDQALKHDKARSTLGEISQFGMLELSRQRIDMELSRGLRVPCANCGGTGHVPTVQVSANNLLRKLREMAAQGSSAVISGILPLEHADFLLNERRESLTELEMEFGIRVHLRGDPNMPAAEPLRLVGEAGAEAAPEQESGGFPERASSESKPAEAGEGDPRKRRRRRRRGRSGADAELETAGEPTADLPLEDREQDAEQDPEALTAADFDDDESDQPGIDAEATEPEDEMEAEEVEEAPAAAHKPAPVVARKPAPKPAGRNADALPTAFTLGRRRARPSADIGGGTAAGQAIYQSTHRPGENDNETVIIPMTRRSDPLAVLSEGVEPGNVLFQSGHRGGDNGGTEFKSEANSEAEGKAAPPTKRPSRGRRRGGRRPAAAKDANAAPADKPRSSRPRRRRPAPNA
ncbi:MAG: Rne/Rng family ribonuclease [SAR324 cluster bacterium]|nr:Rne/Rng family ribonuclease [SAR324 cluster bacterium]